MPGRSLSSTMSPGPISLMPALSSPRIGIKVPRALQEWREVRIGERYLDGLDHLTAGLGEVVGEHGGRLGARRPVGLDDDDFLAAVLGRPLRDDA